jgi:hypothetical protein
MTKQTTAQNSTSRKDIVITALVVLVVIGGILLAQFLTSHRNKSHFESVSYKNARGASYRLDFYNKHATKKLQTGNAQLVSKESKDGKYPLAISINSSGQTSVYDQYKNCGKYKKVFTIHNNHLNQDIHICDMLDGRQVQGQSAADKLYLGVFKLNNQVHVISVAQDYTGVDKTSEITTKLSLEKVGLGPYKSDIQRIISTIQVEK